MGIVRTSTNMNLPLDMATKDWSYHLSRPLEWLNELVQTLGERTKHALAIRQIKKLYEIEAVDKLKSLITL